MGTQGGLNIVGEGGISVLNRELGGIIDITIGEQGQAWVLCSGGLKVFDGQSWKSYQLPEGVYTLGDVVIDSAGRVWVGYYGGVCVLDKGQWVSYSSDKFGLGQFANLVNDVAIDHQDRVWVATSSGVAVFNGNS
jgi:ligand-binding sensor domain-containing protein